MTHEVLHLWAVAETQPSSLPEHPSPFTYWGKLNGVPICLHTVPPPPPLVLKSGLGAERL